jgi:glycerophosphoryl diester phosphodiesterase
VATPPRIEIAGHRGAAGLHPENTLPAFQAALDLGCPWVECDVHASRDGEAVVIHDATLERTTNATGPVNARTRAELAGLDAGHGAGVPALAEVAALARGRARLLCEIKDPAAVDPAVAALQSAGIAEATTFISFQWDALAAVRRVLPGAAVAPLAHTPDPAILDAARELGAVAVDVNYQVVSFAFAAAVHEAGLALYTYTPNTVRALAALAALGVDIATTDRPDLLLPAAAALPDWAGAARA